MSSELMQSGLFGIEAQQDDVIVIANWDGLAREDLLREATTHHEQLKKHEESLEAIISFAKEQKKSVIYERGELYAYMKGRLGYQEWIEWLGSGGVSRSTANEYIQLSTEYRGELAASSAGSKLSKRQLIAAHRTGEGHQILKKIEEGTIQPTQEAINAEIEAAKQRVAQAEADRQQLQQQFDLFKAQTKQEKARELSLKQQEIDLLKREKRLRDDEYARLEREKEQLAQAQKEIILEDTPKTKAELEAMKKKVADLEAQQQKLKEDGSKKDSQLKQKTDRVNQLTDELKKHTEADKQERYNEQIRNKWRQACEAFHQGINQGSARMVSTIDARQAFQSDDWARLAEVEGALRQCLDMLAGLRSGVASLVDASVDYIDEG